MRAVVRVQQRSSSHCAAAISSISRFSVWPSGWYIAPGYQHAFGPNALWTVNALSRRDELNYYPSRDPFADTPITVFQTRFLTNYGVKSDFDYVHGKQNIKIGTQIRQTRLLENSRSASLIRSTIRPVWTRLGLRCCCQESPIRRRAPI